MRIKRNQLAVASTFIMALCMGLPAEIAISITPMRIDYKFQPGKTINDILAVSNTGDQAVRVKVNIQNWQLNLQGSPVFSPLADHPYSCGRWIQINPVDFRLAAGQTRSIRYAITVPQQVEEKSYRSAIMCEIIPDTKPGEPKKVQIKTQIAMVVYGIVGDSEPQCEITGLQAQKDKEKLDFVLQLKNTSGVHFRTKGSITLEDMQGKQIAKLELPDVPALPESERVVRVPYEKTLPKGQYKIVAVLDIGRKELYGAEATFIIE